MPILLVVTVPTPPPSAPGSNPIATFPKDPSAVTDYSIDWSEWLGDDSIVSSTWSIPVGIGQSTTMFSRTLTIIWLVGGSAGTSYSIVNHITTANGRQDERTIKISVVER